MNEKKEHLVWIDVARFLAIFLVICCHCCDPFNLSPAAKTNADFSFWGAFYGSMLRPCVPIFAMMTGVLLLPLKDKSMGVFYKKRLLRVLFPFLLWSLLYNLFPFFVGLFGGSKDVVEMFFPYSGAYGAEPSLGFMDAMKNVFLIPFHFSVYAVHMWYIYMLIGLYLFMPILSAWLDKCSRRSLELYLCLWLVSLFFPYVYNYLSVYFWGTCSWNSFGMLYYFAGFNGYLLLGFYLKKYNSLSLPRTILTVLPIYVLGLLITFFGFRSITSDPSSSEEMIEMFWTYCSPNVVMLTIPCFMLVQKVRVSSSVLVKSLSSISKYGFGIYMCHYFFVAVGYMIVDSLSLPLPMRIPAAAILVFAFSWFIVASAYRLAPKAARHIMG